MERILVTGAAGMVGSHVVELLRSQGRDVIGIGRAECDLLRYDDTCEIFKTIKPTKVFHAAACVYGIIGNMTNAGQSFFENCRINTNVIHASRLAGVQKVTVMGTGCVYPYPPLRTPLVEEDIFMGRPHPSEAGYAHAKLAALAMLEAYSECFEWSYVVSCNLFGPRDKFDPVNGHVVPSLIRKFYEAKRDDTDVTVWGNGSARRDFIYIKDAARAITMIMDRGTGPVNLGTNNVLRIGYVIQTLADIAEFPRERIIWDTSKPNGVDYRGYNLSRLNELGFEPTWPIESGLRETYEWYRDYRIYRDSGK